MNLKVVKYQGTNKFFAALINEKEKYYFFFMKSSPLEINLEQDEDYVVGYYGEKLFPLEKMKLSILSEAMPFSKDKLYSVIEIKESEFDSMYKLLECIYDD